MTELGKLEKVDLNLAWAHEAHAFTPWLAEPENLGLLGDTLGLELELDGIEVAVGPFAADIRCRSAEDGGWVVIENQLRRTDHNHLGQILTYAAGLDARTLVWVASQFTEEHRAALDWLNEHTNEEMSFFGVEIELWRIGSSPPAPKFNLISKPNDWSKTVKKVASEVEGDSEVLRARFEYWAEFLAWLEEHGGVHGRRPTNRHWLNFPLNVGFGHLACIASTFNSLTNRFTPEIRVELILRMPKGRASLEMLQARREELELKVGAPIHWHAPELGRTARIFVQTNEDFSDRSRRHSQFEWLGHHLQLFRALFGPLLRGEA